MHSLREKTAGALPMLGVTTYGLHTSIVSKDMMEQIMEGSLMPVNAACHLSPF